MGHKPDISDEARERIYWEVVSGKSRADIAKETGISRSSISRVMASAPADVMTAYRRRICDKYGLRAVRVLNRILDKQNQLIDSMDSATDLAVTMRAIGETLTRIYPPDTMINVEAQGDFVLETALPEPVTDEAMVADAQDSTYKPS